LIGLGLLNNLFSAIECLLWRLSDAPRVSNRKRKIWLLISWWTSQNFQFNIRKLSLESLLRYQHGLLDFSQILMVIVIACNYSCERVFHWSFSALVHSIWVGVIIIVQCIGTLFSLFYLWKASVLQIFLSRKLERIYKEN